MNLLIRPLITSCLVATPQALPGQETGADEAAAREAAFDQLVEDQDRLLAMVSRLQASLASQQVEQIGESLEAINDPALEALWSLAEQEVDQETILAENETIERILDVAKQLAPESESGGEGGSSSQALLNMMLAMAGRQPQRSPQEGSSEEEQSSEGQNGSQPGQGGSDSGGDKLAQDDAGSGADERRVSSAAGTSAANMPEEYRERLESYFRALEETR